MSLISSSRIYKIGLVCEVIDDGFFDYVYEVFVVDVRPSSGGRRPRGLRKPLFRIPKDYPFSMSFFAFDSSIYFIGGCYPAHVKKENSISADVFVYDTSSGDSTIKKVSCMNYGKLSPVVIGPVNEKFYVIGMSLGNHDFERFDPKLNSWVKLRQPPVPPRPGRYIKRQLICAYALVNNDREILMSTRRGLYSYNIDSDEWSFFAEASLPFFYSPYKGTGCAVSVGGDRFLAFTRGRDDDHMVLGSYRYNISDHSWHDFQYVSDWPIKVECAYAMSLGDGVVSAVVSGYDRPVSDHYKPLADYDDPKPSTHYVAIRTFGDGPNFKRLRSGQYKEKSNMKVCKRKIAASFPFDTLLEVKTSHDDGEEISLWSSGMEKLFVDIMIEQVTRGNMMNSEFDDCVWATILQEMNTKSGRMYTMKQIKQKFNRLRIKHHAFSDLLGTTGFGWIALREERLKGATDFGWDAVREESRKASGCSGTSHPHDDSLEKAMEILCAMPFTAEVRVRAVPMFLNPDYRKMFIHMPEDMRESWLLGL